MSSSEGGGEQPWLLLAPLRVEVFFLEAKKDVFGHGEIKRWQQGGCRGAVHAWLECLGSTGIFQPQHLLLFGVFPSAAAFWERIKNAYAGSQEGDFWGSFPNSVH